MRAIQSAAGLIALTICVPVTGQALHRAPLGVDQGRIDRAEPSTRTRSTLQKAKSKSVPPLAAQASFTIKKISVQGANSLSNAAELMKRFIGQEANVSNLTAAATAIADAYKKMDVAFYTVEITDADSENGQVMVGVKESYVTDIVIEGSASAAWQQAVRKILDPLLLEEPLRRSSYERTLALASDIAGLDVSASMQASDVHGGIALHLDLKRSKASAAIGFHNYGNDLLGADTIEAAARVTGLATVGDEFNLYYSSPTNFHRSLYASASYAIPLDGGGTTLRVNGGLLRTRLLYDLLKGSAVQGGAVISRPLLRRFGRSLTASAGIDFINLENALLGYRLTDDRTRAVRSSLHYMEESARHRLDADVSLSLGVDALSARGIAPLSQPEFAKVNARVDYARQIAARTLFRMKAIGQFSSARLPAAEQIAVGGSDFLRGLSAGLISGDKGVAASFEIAQQPKMPRALAGTEFYAFADLADVRYAQRGPFDAYTYRTSSLGAGARLRIANRASVDMSGAKVIRSPYLGFTDTWRLALTARIAFGG